MASSSKLDAKIPEGQLDQKWTKYRSTVHLVNPANKRTLEIIVVGSGLAGSSAAAAAGFGLPYPGFTGTVAQALRPFPQYTSINDAFQPLGSSTYHALQTKVQKRFSDGLSFLVSYTLSKTLTLAFVSAPSMWWSVSSQRRTT